MSKTLSLSISTDGFEFILFEDVSDTNILKSNRVEFHQTVTPDVLFSEEKLKQISKRLKEEIISAYDDLVVVLPFNRATVKKIVIPANSPKSQKKALIKWELESILPKPMAEYKVSILSSKNNSQISDIINVVALDKDLIKNLGHFAQLLGKQLNGIFLDCFSLENILKKWEPLTKNSMISKISSNYIEHHIFNGGDYYLSYIDFIPKDDRDYPEVVSGLINDRYKQSINILKQTAMSAFDEMQIYIYGKDITKDGIAAVQKHLSTELKLPELDELNTMLGTVDSYNYIEAYGALL